MLLFSAACCLSQMDQAVRCALSFVIWLIVVGMYDLEGRIYGS